jgi:hypothetical protein
MRDYFVSAMISRPYQPIAFLNKVYRMPIGLSQSDINNLILMISNSYQTGIDKVGILSIIPLSGQEDG